jgi:hypothetical protein
MEENMAKNAVQARNSFDAQVEQALWPAVRPESSPSPMLPMPEQSRIRNSVIDNAKFDTAPAVFGRLKFTANLDQVSSLSSKGLKLAEPQPFRSSSGSDNMMLRTRSNPRGRRGKTDGARKLYTTAPVRGSSEPRQEEQPALWGATKSVKGRYSEALDFPVKPGTSPRRSAVEDASRKQAVPNLSKMLKAQKVTESKNPGMSLFLITQKRSADRCVITGCNIVVQMHCNTEAAGPAK